MSDTSNFSLPESNDAINSAGHIFQGSDDSAAPNAAPSKPLDTATEKSLKGPWDFAHCKLGGNGASAASDPFKAPAPPSTLADAACAAASALASGAPQDRRRRRRALISAPVRVRSLDVTSGSLHEISTTVDVSRIGFLFTTSLPSYTRDMEVAVIFPYSNAPTAIHAEQQGRVARVHQMPDGRFAVAIAIGVGVGEDLVDSCGRKLADARTQSSYSRDPESTRPLVLAVDADDVVREALRSYLTVNGYDVIAVKTGAEARQALTMLTPALLIA